MPAVCCRHHALIKSLQRQIEVQYKVQMGDKGTQDSGLGTQDEKEKAPGIILIKHRSQKAQARASESQHVLDVLVVLLPIAFSYIQFFCSNFDFTFSPARTLHFLPISGVYFCALRLLSTFKLIRSAIIQSKIAEVAKAEVRSGGLPKKKK